MPREHQECCGQQEQRVAMRPFCTGAALLPQWMALQMATGLVTLLPAWMLLRQLESDDDGFLMPSRAAEAVKLPHERPVHEEMDAAAVVAALHFARQWAIETLVRGTTHFGCWMMAKSWPVVMVVVRRHQYRQMEMELRPELPDCPQSAATAGAATCSSMRYDVVDELEEQGLLAPYWVSYLRISVLPYPEMPCRMWLPPAGMPSTVSPQAAGVARSAFKCFKQA
ncbi:hypothetical protein ACLKA7_005283 [Drosophila subpalustris]